jgi:hypothetical protein
VTITVKCLFSRVLHSKTNSASGLVKHIEAFKVVEQEGYFGGDDPEFGLESDGVGFRWARVVARAHWG